MKTSCASVARSGGAPLAAGEQRFLLMVADLLATMLASVDGIVPLALGPAELREFEALKLAAHRARNEIVTLVGFFKRRFDAAHAGDFGGRAQKDLTAREGPRACDRQIDGVAFALDVAQVAVHLIEKQIARGHRAQSDR